jgi:hypothetical protein
MPTWPFIAGVGVADAKEDTVQHQDAARITPAKFMT